MTPTRLRECLALLRWSQRGLADALDRQEGTVRQWARGAVTVPPEVAAWLERAGVWHAANPPPSRAPRIP
jgi:DNA-binding transcriptional regulator YdaS (Cro superfamily)